MNERIKELAIDALGISENTDPMITVSKGCLNQFAESIVKECIALLESEKAMCADTGTYESREYYERMAAKEDAFGDAVNTIKYHFGVK